MANIALRSPQFKHIGIPLAGVLSTTCTVTVDGVLRYTLTKNVTPSSIVNFDISELARDFLEVQYDSNFITQYVNIVTVLTNNAGLNGTGASVGSSATFTDNGFESYGTFEEGSNPSSIGGRTSPTVLIAQDNIATTPTFTIFSPSGLGGVIPYIESDGTVLAHTYTSIETSVTTTGGTNVSIVKIDSTKYGSGKKIIFINKFGAQQELWFSAKNKKSLSRSNENYKSNTITYPNSDSHATYSVNAAANRTFNTQAKQSHTLSSGFYPEFANEFFEQLLLSEYVWLERKSKGSDVLEVVPVTVKTSSIAFKTSVNDRLIEYNIEFNEAYDYINNIR
jgi:hypothetical protein|tara:strand:- start:2445 stop:3452 length:1008 start_codon:yes stop_codon:yes gene_type:complete